MSALDSADAFDAVVWGYDPADDELTPLASTERWFEHFPWEADSDGTVKLDEGTGEE